MNQRVQMLCHLGYPPDSGHKTVSMFLRSNITAGKDQRDALQRTAEADNSEGIDFNGSRLADATGNLAAIRTQGDEHTDRYADSDGDKRKDAFLALCRLLSEGVEFRYK